MVILQLPENLDLIKLGEGRIGKIKVYKSGRITLCLNGDIDFNVALSVSGPFLQDAVALDNIENISDNSDAVKMRNLGHINSKIVCSPILF